MLSSPLLLLELLLGGAVLTYIIAARWPGYAGFTAVGILALTQAAWFWLGSRLPYITAPASRLEGPLPLSWSWAVDKAIWPLGGILIFLILALMVFDLGTAETTGETPRNFNWQIKEGQLQPALILALAAAGLALLWSATLMTFMLAWTLLGLLWFLLLLTVVDREAALAGAVHHFFWLLIPLVFAGIAAASQPLGTDLLNMGAWSLPATAAFILMVLAQMGVLPFVGWRPGVFPFSPSVRAVLYLLPPLAGAAMLLRLVSAGPIDPNLLLLVTILALVSMLFALRRIWMFGHLPAKLPVDIALFLSSLSFLVLIWTGTQVFIPAVRFLVFASAVFFLMEKIPFTRARWWRGFAPLAAALAIAGFPLTTGFPPLTALYDIWIANNGYLLIIVLALLLLPLLTAIFLRIQSAALSEATQEEQQKLLFMEAGQILLIFGLIMMGGQSYAEVNWLAWLILLVTAAGALFLSRFVGEAQNIMSMVNEAAAPGQQSLARYWASTEKVSRQMIAVLGEAAAILEGEWGLLWLTAFISLIVMAITV